MDAKWHDVPPVPGYYQWIGCNGVAGASLIEHPKSWTGPAWDGWHFYGPLPDPPPIPEPPKPPRLFRCSAKHMDNELRFGVEFPNGTRRIFSPNGHEKNLGLESYESLYTAPEYLT